MGAVQPSTRRINILLYLQGQGYADAERAVQELLEQVKVGTKKGR